jgi:hypothetical protein
MIDRDDAVPLNVGFAKNWTTTPTARNWPIATAHGAVTRRHRPGLVCFSLVD